MVYDAAVVGAGVAGIATAYTLQRAGFRTVMLERRERPALETSFANGGIITPSMSEPWAAPGIPRLLWSSIGREEAPFLLRLGALPGMLRWGGRFLLNCTQARWQQNCLRLMQLSLLSQRCLNTVAGAEGLQHLLRNTGSLRLLPDDAALLEAGHDMRRAGQRPMTANGLPVLARVRNDVFAHLGHGHLGWTCAFGGAKRILDLIERS